MKYLLLVLCSIFVLGCSKKHSKGNNNNNPPKAAEIYRDSIAESFFKRESGVTGADGGASVLLNNGTVLWTFGDSYIDHYDAATNTIPCLFQVRNAAVIQQKDDWNWRNAPTLLGNVGTIKSYFRNTTDNNFWFWPTDGFQVGDTVYVYQDNMTIVPGGTGLGGFKYAGPPVMAKINVNTKEVVAYQNMQDVDTISFGSGFVKDEPSGHFLIYGSKLKSYPYGNVSIVVPDIYLARVPINNPSRYWEFWTGSSWTKDIRQIKKIGEATAFTGTVNIRKVKDKYLLLSTALSFGCDGGKEIFASVSDNPTGPFSEGKSIYTIKDTVQGHYPFFYNAIPHPEYINSKNELLITYCINGYGNCIPGCVNGRLIRDFYRIRCIRLSLELVFSK